VPAADSVTCVEVGKLDALLLRQRRALNQHQGSKRGYPEPGFARSKVCAWISYR
jgi:hypothetical protein